ncbi:hydantoinase/oxoprolinase family protein [soil metagenome]
MAVRIGVDVGGTFTKAVACEAIDGEVVARAVVPTTHSSGLGVADGVVLAVARVAEEVGRAGLGPVQLVAHSTTQAVNALLEGDTSVVGVLGIGRRPDLRKARKRTRVGEVQLAPGRRLKTLHEFIDSTNGSDRDSLADAVGRLKQAGVEAVVVSEAFSVEDAQLEELAVDLAGEAGLPACGGHELSGLYGLEMRTVTGALNASILPTALSTARIVADAVRRDIPGVPVLVMRGDGGAADLQAMRRHPLLTAFSGPAASVAGTLRHLPLTDAVVVEVGGTSTNVSAVKGGRPILAYVRVLEHVTCVRSLDVRVAGVAGGSLIRLGSRFGRLRVEEVGPRSAHIAGLPYCSFAHPEELARASAERIAPRADDPPEYAVVVTPDGRRFALTLTCAANALGEVPAGTYAKGNRDAARLGFEALGRLVNRPWEALAKRVLELAMGKVGRVVGDCMASQGRERPVVVGVGGGAGALVPALGRGMGLDWRIPPDAEVISSVGDALSLVRVEVEKTVARSSPAELARLHLEAERAAVAAGASPASLQVESQAVPERQAMRVVALGSVALDGEAHPADARRDEKVLAQTARDVLGPGVELVAGNFFYAVFCAGEGEVRRFGVVDRHGTLATTGKGRVVAGFGHEVGAHLAELLPRLVRHIGPVVVAPAVRIVRGPRLVDLAVLSSPEKVLAAALAECELAEGEPVAAIISRS